MMSLDTQFCRIAHSLVLDGFLNTQIKILVRGVPVMAQWKQIQLGAMRLRVRSLASISALRILRCHELWCRSQMQLGPHVAVAVV